MRQTFGVAGVVRPRGAGVDLGGETERNFVVEMLGIDFGTISGLSVILMAILGLVLNSRTFFESTLLGMGCSRSIQESFAERKVIPAGRPSVTLFHFGWHPRRRSAFL